MIALKSAIEPTRVALQSTFSVPHQKWRCEGLMSVLTRWRNFSFESRSFTLKRRPIASKALEFRKQAEESCKRAQTAAGSSEQKHWLEVAAHWLRMATTEDGRNEGEPPPP